MTEQLRALVELTLPMKMLSFSERDFDPLINKFPDIQFEFPGSFEKLTERISEPDIIFSWFFPKSLYSKAHNLKMICTPTAGDDWVPRDSTGRVKTVYGTFHGKLIAESLLGMMLYFNNNYHITLKNQYLSSWQRTEQLFRPPISGQHVLLIGYGHIGKYCSQLLTGLGFTVSGLRRTVLDGLDEENGAEYVSTDNLMEELKKADHVVALLPLSNENKGLIDSLYFQQMKPSAFFYNFGRGTTVNEKDLINALKKNTIAGAGLDVFETEPLGTDSPLWKMENVLITPHASCFYTNFNQLYIQEVGNILNDWLNSR